MAWKIKVDKDAGKTLKKLDKPTAKRIYNKLKEIGSLEDPRTMGKALTGNLSGLWRYRVGDYRIVCYIQDDILVVLVVDIDHRSSVYHKKK